MTAPDGPTHYRSPDEDSARWLGFAYRPGDIVISTRSKTGTTWAQMICALLVFQTADLPAPLSQLSPWLDWLIVPREEVFAQLAAQQHRRFIKTHTPLDGLPLDNRATYIVTGRHPLDAAVSLFHQGENIDRARLRSLTGRPPVLGEPPPLAPLARPAGRVGRWRRPAGGPARFVTRGYVAPFGRVGTAGRAQRRSGPLRRPGTRSRSRNAPPGCRPSNRGGRRDVARTG